MNTFNRGERTPDFVLPISNGSQTRFYACAGGRPTLLIFTQDDLPSIQGLIPEHVDTFIVTPADMQVPNATVFIDAENTIRKAYRINDGIAAFALDTNLRILASVQQIDAIEQIHKVFASLPHHDPIDVTTQAPVMLIPNILTPDICNALMNVWASKGNEETGVERSESGERLDAIDHQNKKRRDHTVTDAKLLQLLTSTVGRRVMPELQRAFHYRATRFEGFKIACYDSETGGFFHAHRDNLSPSTAHRRFALTLTLNLNDNYEGGHLTFPEFGPHRYRPPAGGAVVFSCAFLHEVRPITQGRRFTLLSFLYSENRE